MKANTIHAPYWADFIATSRTGAFQTHYLKPFWHLLDAQRFILEIACTCDLTGVKVEEWDAETGVLKSIQYYRDFVR